MAPRPSRHVHKRKRARGGGRGGQGRHRNAVHARTTPARRARNRGGGRARAIRECGIHSNAVYTKNTPAQHARVTGVAMVGARARAIRECGQRRSTAHAHGYGICAMRAPPAGDCGHRPPDRNPIPRPPYPEGRYSQTPIARIWRCGCCSQEERACVECGALAFAMRPMRLCWFWGV